MNSVKKGFTLIEILIAVTIVGILAAMIIPFLATNIQRMQTGPRLARVVRQLEIGVRNIIEECNANISNTGASGDRLSFFTQNDFIRNGILTNLTQSWDIIAPSLGLEPIEIDDEDIIIRNYDNSVSANQETVRTNGLRYVLAKQNSVVYITPNPVANNNANSIIVRLDIDTNGREIPNAYGRDIFLFGLTNEGKVVPFGLGAGNDHYTVACTDNNITDGRACSARVVKDGFRINY